MASPTADAREAQLRDNIVLQRCRPEVVTWPNARKMASRLELLHNTTSRDVFLKRKACEFTTIEETQPSKDSGGCRFISDVMFRELFGKHLACKSITTIQVRMYSPRLGVIRSMLRRKLGIEKIHLPASKMKAPSPKVSEDDWVVMVVTRETPFQHMHLQMSNWLQGKQLAKSWKQHNYTWAHLFVVLCLNMVCLRYRLEMLLLYIGTVL